MKKVFLFLITASIIACNTPSEKSDEATLEGLSQLPSNAEKEPYSDDANRVKVTIKAADGKITAQGDYLNGKKHGSWLEYHNNELVRSSTSYIDGIKQGPHTEIDDRGQLTVSTCYNQGNYHGLYLAYVRTKVTERRRYVNGKLEGLLQKYYENGGIQEESPYSNGKLNGVSKWYDQEGNIKFEYEYENGSLIKN